MMERMRRSITPSAGFAALLDAKNFAERLPGRINRILDSLANQELKVKVELIDEGAVLEGLQKVANRITLGLILAAMIIGAAMLMRVETTFRILGYPGPRDAVLPRRRLRRRRGWRSASCATISAHATADLDQIHRRSVRTSASAVADEHAASADADARDLVAGRVDRDVDAARPQHLHALQADDVREASRAGRGGA